MLSGVFRRFTGKAKIPAARPGSSLYFSCIIRRRDAETLPDDSYPTLRQPL